MKRIALCLFSWMVLSVTSFAQGDELTAKDYIEFVKPFVGSWKTTVESDGKIAEGTWMARESRTGTCLTTFGTGDLAPAQTIDGYDPVSKKWTVAAFDASGGYSLSKIEFDNITKGKQFGKGTTGTGETKVNKSDGTTTIETTKLTCLECTKDKIVILWSERTENGKSVPDVTMTSERQQQTQRGSRVALDLPAIPGDYPTAHDYVEYWQTFKGSWNTSTESDEESVPGTWIARLSRTKTCYTTYGEGGGFPPVQTIDGFDPVTKKWTVAAFDADGEFSIATTAVLDMKKGKRLAEGLIGKSEMKRFLPDGSTTTITSDLSCAEYSQNRLSLLSTKRSEDGKALPDQKWTVERQPERKRSARQSK